MKLRKIYSILLLAVCCFSICQAQNGTQNVTITVAGTLKNKLAQNEWQTISSIKVTGPINTEDLAVLGTYAKADSGKLSKIDLKDANIFVIGDEAFVEATNLTSITLPNKITEIGKSAFGGCKKLNNVNIPSTVKNIGNYAFAECESLTTINLPEGLGKISDGCFADCKSLKNITLPSHITRIGKEAFARCTQISTIDIPADVASIGGGAFAGCENLSFIKVNTNNKKYCSTGGGVLYSKDGKYILQYPCGKSGDLYTVPAGVIRVGSYAFSGAKKIKQIEIPSSCTSIGYGAFLECSSLKKVNLPSTLEKIDEDMFYGCSSIEDIKIPGTITSIGKHAFYNCTSLKQITIPETVTQIGRQAFTGCSSLKEIKLPNNIQRIEDGTFSNCSKIETVTLPLNLTFIGQRAFSADNTLSKINIPSNVSKIETGAFAGCENLKSIELPDKLKTIGDVAFFNTGLSGSISLPQELDSIGVGLFSRCDSLKEIIIKSNKPAVASVIAEYALTDTIKLSVPKGKEDAFHNANGWGQFRHINDIAYEIIHDSEEDDNLSNSISLIEGANSAAYSSSSLIYSTNQSEQTPSKPKEDLTIYAANDLDAAATYEGGESALKAYIQKKMNISGVKNKASIDIEFTVEKDGSTNSYNILKSAGDELDAEAISIIYGMSNWKAAQKDGKTVRSTKKITINF